MNVKKRLKISFCWLIRIKLAPNVELGEQNTQTGENSRHYFGAHGYLLLHFGTYSIRATTTQHFRCCTVALMVELVCTALAIVEANEFSATCIAMYAAL
jgi:hypothetical protein